MAPKGHRTAGEVTLDKLIGRRLREARAMAGMSQEDLAAASGVSFQQIQKYETGANRVSASRLVTLAAALRCDPAYLLGKAPAPIEETELTRDKHELLRAWGRLEGREQQLVIHLARLMSRKDSPVVAKKE